MLFDRFDPLTLQCQDCLFSFDVLLLEGFFLIAGELVLLDLFHCRQLGDLFDPFGIKDVRWAEHLEWCLLEIIDCRVIETVAIEIGANDLQDLFLEFVSLIIEIDEIKLFTDRLESFTELSVKQFTERFDFATAFGSNRLGNLFHFLLSVVHSDEECDFDVGANVITADQAFTSLAADLKTFQREIHEFEAMEQRDDEFSTCGGDIQSTEARFDDGSVWSNHNVVFSECHQRRGDCERNEIEADHPSTSPIEIIELSEGK